MKIFFVTVKALLLHHIAHTTKTLIYYVNLCLHVGYNLCIYINKVV